MTVADMRRRMGNDEYLLWTKFYARKAQQIELEQLKAGG